MKEEEHQLSLKEKWEIDNKSAVKVLLPQCEQCINVLINTPIRCKAYTQKKPIYVLGCKRECEAFKHKTELCLNIDKRYKFILGGILGFIVGDIIGIPVEFEPRETRKKDPVREMRAYGTYHQPFGTWSDDTSMTLCLIESLTDGYDLNNIVDKYIDFYLKGYWTPYGEVFDIGNATRNAIERMAMGIDPLECGGTSLEDNGNGSLMRILPVAFYAMKANAKDRIELTEKISSLTHAHKRAKLGCIIYVEYAVQLIILNDKNKAYEKMIQSVYEHCSKVYKDELATYKRIFSGKLLYEEEENIQATGYIVDSIEAALWCFHNTNSYKEAILKAVNLGEDTDTIAAITGGLAGILYGYEQIPDTWIQCMARNKEIYELVSRFAQSVDKPKNV